MTAVNSAASQQAVVEAALVLLERMGLSPADLTAVPQARKPVPTFAEYVPVVSAAVSAGTRRAYGSYWNRIVDQWGGRRLDEPTPSEIRQLMVYVKTHVVARRNARGGRSAQEHLVAALRCLYRRAVDDGLIAEAENPARKVAKPRRLPTTRRALPDARLAEINQIAATTGDDPELDTLLLRLHTETACRRGGALALRPRDLDPDQCLVLLREKGETVRWQPVSPTLMARLVEHGRERHAPPDGQLLRYGDGKPITSRRYDHLWTRLGRHLPWVATQGISTHWIRHTIPDVGRAELRLRRGPRLRRPHRQRQRGRRHGDVRPRRPRGGGRRAGRADRRGSPARHDGRVVTGMAAVTIDASPATDQGLRGPVPARTAGPSDADQSPATAKPGRTVRSWPLLVLAAPAAAEVWSGWVGMAQKTGFGLVRPLPGIWPSLHLDTAITLPVGVEAYAAYALRAWLARDQPISARTRRFAKWSAISSFALGMAGQVAYHLMAQAGMTRAPWTVTTIVSCLPVLVLGMGTALAHMLRADAAEAPGSGTGQPVVLWPVPRSQEGQGGPDRGQPEPDRDRSASRDKWSQAGTTGWPWDHGTWPVASAATGGAGPDCRPQACRGREASIAPSVAQRRRHWLQRGVERPCADDQYRAGQRDVDDDLAS